MKLLHHSQTSTLKFEKGSVISPLISWWILLLIHAGITLVHINTRSPMYPKRVPGWPPTTTPLSRIDLDLCLSVIWTIQRSFIFCMRFRKPANLILHKQMLFWMWRHLGHGNVTSRWWCLKMLCSYDYHARYFHSKEPELWQARSTEYIMGLLWDILRMELNDNCKVNMPGAWQPSMVMEQRYISSSVSPSPLALGLFTAGVHNKTKTIPLNWFLGYTWARLKWMTHECRCHNINVSHIIKLSEKGK